MKTLDLYSVLEVAPGCGQRRLLRAYRRQAQKWHPDRHQSSAMVQVFAQKKMQDINVAYATLRKVELESATRSTDSCHKETRPGPPPSPIQPNSPKSVPSSHDVWSQRPKQPPPSRASQHGQFLWGLLGALLLGGYGSFLLIESPNSQRSVLAQSSADAGYTLATATSREQHIRIGSRPRDVLEIQGMPSSVAGNTWFYEDSHVIFGSTGVVKWHNSFLTPLKVKSELP